MNGPNPYKDFTDRLKLLSSKHPDLITTTLSNVFTMRLIGNKTHGDLAEIAIAEFINQRCNILVFDYNRATSEAACIRREEGRKHPVYRFYNIAGDYICEVRYGDATANALQRGLWTHTKNGLSYFESITGGWVDYSHNPLLVELFSHALVSSSAGHTAALAEIKEDIARLQHGSGIAT